MKYTTHGNLGSAGKGNGHAGRLTLARKFNLHFLQRLRKAMLRITKAETTPKIYC